jgi:hypothetical protein
MRCTDSGLHLARRGYLEVIGTVPGLRIEDAARDAGVRVRFPVRIPAGAAGHEIVLPEIALACQGRVVSVPAGSTIEKGGRRAFLAADGIQVDGTLVLEWSPGSPGCPELPATGSLPFFIEAEPGTASLMQELIEEDR